MQYEQITTEYISEEVKVFSGERSSRLHEGLRRAGVYLMYAFAALLPIWVIPWQTGVALGREITFGVIIVLAFIAWLLSVLMRGEMRWLHSLVGYSALALLVVFGISTIFSKAPFYSAFFSDSIGERFSVLLLGIILFILASGLFRSRREVWNAVFVMVMAGAVAGLLHLIQLIFGFSLYRFILPFGVDNYFNVIGTANAPALFSVVLFAITLGLVRSVADLKPWVRYVLWAALFIFFLNILLVSFQTAWITLLGTGIVLFGFTFRTIRTQGVTLGYLAALGVIVLSIVMILIGTPFFNFGIPADVSPSLGTTISIGNSVFREGIKTVLVGSGPGTFGLDWGLYKPASINQEIFWNARFHQGFSWVVTLLPTVGVLGVLAFFAFVGSALFLLLKSLLLVPERMTPLSVGTFLGFVALLLTLVLYPVNLTFLLLFFFLAGLLALLLSDEGDRGSDVEDSWVSVLSELKLSRIQLEAPWAVFLSSLVMISLLSFSVAALYGETNRVRSGFLRHAAVRDFNDGEFDRGVTRVARAAALESKNFRVQQELIQARTRKIQNLIQRAAAGETVQQEFQAEVSRADADAQRLIQLHPVDPAIWRARAALYELLIPFIPGAERIAFESYEQASRFEPLNPSIYSDWGRAGLAYTDRLRLLVGQTRGEEQAQLEELRVRSLNETVTVLNRSVELKPDFATGHFLLSQAAIRLNNLQAAIESTQRTKQAAPFDIGVAFQLALLYYQSDDLDRAQAEFERAVTLNTDYSNARYFLGLIYDRKGDKNAALVEFERVAALNPDNEEVQRIISNLQRGRDALAGIVPPAEPPAQRSRAPVQ